MTGEEVRDALEAAEAIGGPRAWSNLLNTLGEECVKRRERDDGTGVQPHDPADCAWCAYYAKFIKPQCIDDDR